jgi:hypothetical protein
MNFRSSIEKYEDSNVWGTIMMVPQEVSSAFLKMDNRRTITILDGRVKMHAALMPRGDGRYYVTINRENFKKLNKAIGEEFDVEMIPDNSEFGMPVPDELIEAFDLFPEGKCIFDSFTKGKQRTLIYMASKPKTSETRIKKAVMILEYLEYCKGKLDYKEMNEYFKNFNKDYKI